MCRTLHKEDRALAIQFIDYVRVEKSSPVRVGLEIYGRKLAEHIGINPEQSNTKIANAFARKFEANLIK